MNKPSLNPLRMPQHVKSIEAPEAQISEIGDLNLSEQERKVLTLYHGRLLISAAQMQGFLTSYCRTLLRVLQNG
jgi:hypothetical protein